MRETLIKIYPEQTGLGELNRDSIYEEFQFRAGDKLLSIQFRYLQGDSPVVVTKIENVLNTDKIPGSTTALFTTAVSIVEQASQQLNIALLHRFETINPNLIAWAQNKGHQVFRWKDRDIKVNDGKVFKAEILVRPQK